jgi:cyclopropane fatty-acyl-phospholipid synthase-like methyltransferase
MTTATVFPPLPSPRGRHGAPTSAGRGHTWIHKYIFPGGQIPSLQAINDGLRAHTGLRVAADYPMGQHYARTLQGGAAGSSAPPAR